MPILQNIAIVVATVAAMEATAWGVHKYVMHGWGWGWHQSHHEPHDNVWEKNDLYAVVFAVVAGTIFVVTFYDRGALYWVGVGMTLYGLLYFIVHDGLVHQRWPFRYVPHNPYLKRLVQAHRLHHAVEGREDCVSFGFLYARPVRALKQELQSKHPDGSRTLVRDAPADGQSVGR